MGQFNLWLGGVLPNGSCFCEELWMWDQFNLFPLLSPTTVSHFSMPNSWHQELVRWPSLPPFLTSMREIFPVAVLCEIIQHLYFN